MRVVVTVAGLSPADGGPSRTVPSLCAALAEKGVEVEVITLCTGSGYELVPAGWKLTVVPKQCNKYSPFWQGAFCSALTRALHNKLDTVLYDVGLWLPSNHFAARFALMQRIPFVSSPRGMLSRAAIETRRWRKEVAWLMYQKRDLRTAAAIHATSSSEAEDIRRAGLRRPIAMVPNGVLVPPETVRARCSQATRIALFLSRIHPIKGLFDLLSAWAAVRPTGWRLVIAGNDEGGHEEEVRRRVAESRIDKCVTFVGHADEQQKAFLFASADIFILPSHSESFGLAIAEAMAAGLPVITTHATPWAELDRLKCGWWVPVGAENIAAALRDATSRSPEELCAIGSRGRRLVAEKYSWEQATAKMQEVFAWLAGKRDLPAWMI